MNLKENNTNLNGELSWHCARRLTVAQEWSGEIKLEQNK